MSSFALFLLAASLLAGCLPALAILPQEQPAEGEIPPLQPPKPELPPGFWEQNGFWVLAAVVLCLTLTVVACLLFIYLRAQPPPEPVVRARHEIEPLLGKAEDGEVLTRVSHALKAYFQSAFLLPQGEFTTTEFCRLISADPRIGSELELAIGNFLRRSDRRKFSPGDGGEPVQAARVALELVAAGEQRRKELEKQQAENAPRA